jgi:hypothetical protein
MYINCFIFIVKKGKAKLKEEAKVISDKLNKDLNDLLKAKEYQLLF